MKVTRFLLVSFALIPVMVGCGKSSDLTSVAATLDPYANHPDYSPSPSPSPTPGAASTPTPTPVANGKPTPTPTPSTPNIVVFHIPAGTGKAAWNTAATILTLKVGQTLMLVNDDTVNHELHTSGGVPCAHGKGVIAPNGGTAMCGPVQAFVSGTRPPYDHTVGPAAPFYIDVTL